jgi:hypothetical protein
VPASSCGCEFGSHSKPPPLASRLRRTPNDTGLCVPLRNGVASTISLNSSTISVSRGAEFSWLCVGETIVARGATPLRSTMPRVTCSVHVSVRSNGLPDVLRTTEVCAAPPGIVIV